MAKRETTTFAGGLRFLHMVGCLVAIFLGNVGATQYTAAATSYPMEFGDGLLTFGQFRLYQPFAFWAWNIHYYNAAVTVFNIGWAIIIGSVIVGVAAAFAVAVWRARRSEEASSHGSARWGDVKDLEKAALLTGKGVVLGRTDEGKKARWITHDGPEHVEVVAPSRSGKGTGIVVPTLLNWRWSALINDIKGELWILTSAWRKKFSYVMRFSPSERDTCRFNPLMEVRKGDYEVKDVQNITDMIVDPDGKGKPDHWSKEGDAYLVAIVLHVLYAERDKTLAGVAYFLNHPERTLDDTLNIMLTTRHLGDRPHPVVAMGARAMMNKSENERSGVYSTARSFFSLYLDPIVAAATSESDFRIDDLRKAAYPLSLYMVSPPSDKARIRPVFRLVQTQIQLRLTEKMGDPDVKHRVLFALDELPAMGKLAQLQEGLGFLAGYGIKVLMISQSENQKIEVYGQNNTLSDGAHISVYYAPNTAETAKKISDSLGEMTEIVQQKNYGGNRLSMFFGHVMVSSNEIKRELMTPGEVREMPKDQELIVVAGVPPVKAKKGHYYLDVPFKDMVPPTHQDVPDGDPRKGMPSVPNHPLNPPSAAELEARPYPFAPPERPTDWAGMFVAQAKTPPPAAAAALAAMQATQGTPQPTGAQAAPTVAVVPATAGYGAGAIPAGGLGAVPAVTEDGELEEPISHAKTEVSAAASLAAWGAAAVPAVAATELLHGVPTTPRESPVVDAAPSAEAPSQVTDGVGHHVGQEAAPEPDEDDGELLEAPSSGNDEPPADDEPTYTFV
ncbi:IncP-type conjugal transfer protein TraG (plasmid) [Dyella sp. BiH032]|uniref:IncP-type conjugal transfer protein TraG n=1 Tax=Dyella sp. BiH032 TaxID=3075430 RepID=UPI0028929A26|nr:IncP-type conjugal transfer protein TraG [Dyella sp. BiH032]WNL48572.1 IncP-type conjugal transfer protein TraG [Dyella sp. BiH032]